MNIMTLTEIRDLFIGAQQSANLSRVTMHVTRVHQAIESLNALIAGQPVEQPRGEYPECSGDPSSCPENEGYGCCGAQPKPEQAKGATLTGAFYLGGKRLDTSDPDTLDYVRSRFEAKPKPEQAVGDGVGSFGVMREVIELMQKSGGWWSGKATVSMPRKRAFQIITLLHDAIERANTPRPAVATPAEEVLKLDPDTNECSPDPVVRKAWADGYDTGFAHGKGDAPAEVTDGGADAIVRYLRTFEPIQQAFDVLGTDEHEALVERIAALAAQPSAVGVPEGLADPNNPWRRAVEHAGYLVARVESYMKARWEESIALEQVEGADDPTDEQLAKLEAAAESAHEHWIGMRAGIYEFTKRRDRALATLAAAPEVPK